LSAPIGIFFGRIANFINSELYGTPTEVPWSVKFIAVDNINRHPSQLYEAFLEGIVLFFMLQFILKKNFAKKTGQISCLFLILYSFFRIITEFFRTPDLHIGYLFFNLTLGQLISAVFLSIGLALYFYLKNEN
jgi:phosphatidylglycerol:prolipoprotein diacylglycerol transferase